MLVAEVSSNHGADLERALSFVDAAAELGFGAVKFQQFRVRKLFAPEALRAHPELLAREAWELPEAFNAPIAERAHSHGLAFQSTPFYLDAVPLLAPLVDAFKVASYQLLWHDLLRAVAATGRPTVLATGMATLDEVGAAVDVLRSEGVSELTLLHCVSAYPTPMEESNLAAIETLRNEFGGAIGWSDHTVNIDVVVRAVHRYGARAVELHLDLDGAGAEYGGGHCWLPEHVVGLGQRLAKAAPEPDSHPADGDGVKAPRACERDEVEWRTDPADGLRPLLSARAGFTEKAGT